MTGFDKHDGEALANGDDCTPEPIAIIGASCRLPGAAHNLEKLWELLREGKSAWSKTPANRFNQSGFHGGSGDIKQGTTNTDGGHFLEQDITAFDAAFFGIHATEANAMDPQQRLLLEIAYESFESAGFTIEQLSDSNTGVYVGEWASDYHEILTRDLDYPPTYLISGTGAAISSNRISYTFNLKGPSFTLDTGCSASLVALHQAVQSLRIGETEQCFVGGVNLILDPQHYAYQSKLKMFSNEGKSFPFDRRANGYGRGEGCSGVVLQPLSLAQKQGRPIRAIIRNSVVNQDGYTSGITVPSSAAQSAAIRKAYAQVHLDTHADYVEAHGTGTRTGDPIEAKAIAAVLSAYTDSESALPIGSIKGNVGHTESAAGLTGLLKAILMLEHNTIPPQVNSEYPNPAIPLAKLKLRLPQKLEHRQLRRISVNSFGYGGTNAHVIVESAETLFEQRTSDINLEGDNSLGSIHDRTNGNKLAIGPVQRRDSNEISDMIHINGYQNGFVHDKTKANGADSRINGNGHSKNVEPMNHQADTELIDMNGVNTHANGTDHLESNAKSMQNGIRMNAVDSVAKGNNWYDYLLSKTKDQANTNGKHVVTNGHRDQESTIHAVDENSKQRLFVISAASETSCQSMAASLAHYLNGKSASVLDQLAYTLSRRTILTYRLGVIASTVEDLARQLTDLSTEPVPASRDRISQRAAFIFSGQGAQYPQMGRELLGTWPTFTTSLERASACLRRCGSSWDLLEELVKPSDSSRMERPEIAQPSTTAIQLALVDTLRQLGVVPAIVAGHSSGEIAAAYCAGALDFDDAIKTSFHRGRLTGELLANLTGPAGAMLAVGTSSAAVEEIIESMADVAGKVKIACYNSPASVTVSGDAGAIDALQLRLEQEGVFNRRLRTGGAAYHSGQMKQIAAEYALAIQSIKVSKPDLAITMVSSLTGKEVRDVLLDADYWVKNLTSPVLFEQAVLKLCKPQPGVKQVDFILELGPHSQLNGPVKQILKTLGQDVGAIECSGTLRRGQDAESSMLECMRFLYLQRYPVNLRGVNRDNTTCKLLTDLPPYAFDRSRTYWHESRASKRYRNREHLPHEILGNLSHENDGPEPQWRCYLRLDDVPWLRGHVVQNEIVFPAAGFISMAVQAAQQNAMLHSREAITEVRLRNISIGNALVLKDGEGDLELFIKLRPQTYSARKSSDIWNEFRIFTVSSVGIWTEHCRGLVHVILDAHLKPLTFASPPTDSKERKTHPRKFYHLSRDAGLEWTDPFDNLRDIRTTSNTSTSRVTSSTVLNLSHGPQGPLYVIHPALLDSCLFQSLFAVLLLENNVTVPVIPTFIKHLSIRVPEQGVHLTEMTCHAIRTRNFLTFDITVVHDTAGTVALQAEGVTATKLPSLSSVTRSERELCHGVEWVATMSAVSERWLRETCRSTIEKTSIAMQHRELSALALSYIQPVLASFSREDVPEGHLRYWYDWMRTCATQEYSPEVLCRAVEDESVGARALKRIGPHLEELLRGSIHSLSLLTEGDLLSQVYTDERCRRCYKQMARYCTELGRERPGLKILEIGGGTASASRPILEALQHAGRSLVSRYDFTDISPAFFEAARNKLAEFQDVLNFKPLNIEHDPIGQDFTLGDYDLVIAANIVHATSSIDRSVEHVRSLLRPGGKFMLMEITEDLLYLNLVFGTLSGWWAGYDEGRTLSPLLSEQAWSAKLRSHGFRTTQPMFRDHEPEDGGTQCVFISEAYSEMPPLGAVDIVASTHNQAFASQLKAKIETSALTNEQQTTILLDPSCLLDEDAFQAFQHHVTSSKAILFVSNLTDAPESVLSGEWATGFCRSLRLEHTDIRFISLLLHGSIDESKIDIIIQVLQSSSMDLAVPDSEVDLEFSEQDGQLFVPRIIHLQSMSNRIHGALGRLPPIETPFQNGRSMLVELGTPGLFETIRYTDDLDAQPHLGPEDVKIRLCSASVNFKEVLIASGQLEGIDRMVNDGSGIVIEVGEKMQHRYKPGDRVCALEIRSYQNYPILHGDHIHRIPDDMDFDTAAAIPVVWITVFYSLVDCGRLQRGDKILIHSAAGAVGQAAIQFARHVGAEIFTTCGNDRKKRLLIEEFGIAEDHIFSSRTAGFRDGIMALTSGYGVDVVLNSLGGELLRESCDTVAPFGRFVEIGRKDLMEDALLPIEFMLKNVTFSYVDMARITATRKRLTQRLLNDAMGLFASGSVQSVMLTKMPISKISDAFRFVQAGKHVGKVVLTVEPDQYVMAVPPRPLPANLDANATYIITGGLGGLGKQIIAWLAEHGARHVVTISRSGAIDEDSQTLIEEMQSVGVALHVKKCDISSASTLEHTLAEIVTDMPPIRGLIQSTMVLQDSLFADMTADRWSAALAPKVKGTWNLHALLPARLDFFIMLSSAVAIAGNVGQSNYSAACSFQDGFARHRVRLGLRAHSINVGAIAEAGFVSENPEVAVALRRKGLGTVAIADFLSHLDHILTLQKDSPSIETCQTAIGLIPMGDEPGLGPGTWMNDRKYALLGTQDASRMQDSDDCSNVERALGAAVTLKEATEVACRATIEQVGKIIGLLSENISAARSLNSYGVDSLVAVELRNWINIHLKANLSLLTVRSTASIGELAELVAKESKLVSTKVKAGE